MRRQQLLLVRSIGVTGGFELRRGEITGERIGVSWGRSLAGRRQAENALWRWAGVALVRARGVVGAWDGGAGADGRHVVLIFFLFVRGEVEGDKEDKRLQGIL